ncbi:MAG: type II 3-dehydroquinate dehydratase [Pseudomonadota bacterium]
MAHIAVLHGPNLNMLGQREPEVYGHDTLDDINTTLEALASSLGHTLSILQSNSEAVLIDTIQALRGVADGLIFNPGGFTHTSVALCDAVIAAEVPTIEVHLSNIHAREAFRAHSYISGVAKGVICGLGAYGYHLALQAFSADILSEREPE